jgi:hypothetical protein
MASAGEQKATCLDRQGRSSSAVDKFSKKAKEGLQKGVEFLRHRAQETVELHKATSHLKELQKRHEECIRDLGYRTYAMLQKGTLDQRVLRERYVEALELEKAIQRAIKEQENIRDRYSTDLQIFVPPTTAPIYCPYCQATVPPSSSRCPECEAPMPGRTASQESPGGPRDSRRAGEDPPGP